MGLDRSQSIVVATRQALRRKLVAAVFVGLCIFASSEDHAKADQGGLSYWLPGTFGSLAAAPGVPGWAYSTIYLHVATAAQGDKEFVKGGSVVAGLNATADAVAQGLTYTFATPVLGGQAGISVLGVSKPRNCVASKSPRSNTVMANLHRSPHMNQSSADLGIAKESQFLRLGIRSFNFCMGRSIAFTSATMDAISSPPPHSISLGGLRTPAAEYAAPSRKRPASETLHINGSRQPYSITSSARASSVGGISSPSALAVFRLTISSSPVGCSMGSSPASAPSKIFFT